MKETFKKSFIKIGLITLIGLVVVFSWCTKRGNLTPHEFCSAVPSCWTNEEIKQLESQGLNCIRIEETTTTTIEEEFVCIEDYDNINYTTINISREDFEELSCFRQRDWLRGVCYPLDCGQRNPPICTSLYAIYCYNPDNPIDKYFENIYIKESGETTTTTTEQIVGGCGTVTPGMEDECCQNLGYERWDRNELRCN